MDGQKEKTTGKNQRARLSVILGVALIIVGLVCAVLAVTSPFERAPAPTPTPTEAPPTPSPTPTVESISLYAFGRELNGDGFTAYVGDKPFTLTAEIVSDAAAPEVVWSVSDSESISLTVSKDGLSCEFSALKPSGKNELTVRCYGAEVVIPVYLWER